MFANAWRKRIEHKLDSIFDTLKKGLKTMSDDFATVLASIDAATNTIGSALSVEGSVISSLSTEVASIRTQLANTSVPQDVLDRMGSISSRLLAASATIGAQTTQLQAIAADPANPVPVPTPTPAPATPTPGT